MRRIGRLGAAAGIGLTAYAAWEARAYTLRRLEVPLLPAGSRPLTVLHLSDIHMTPGQRRKQEWLRGLASLEPDLVVDTGDNLAHRDSVSVVRDALGPLLDRPGVFVHGSNDYFAPFLRNPIRLPLPAPASATPPAAAPVARPDARRCRRRAGSTSPTAGRRWWSATPRSRSRVSTTRTCAIDRLDEVAGPADTDADVRLGITHAPYLRVLDQYAADGYDAVLAGHTHGGQVCLPGIGALTTNCDLEAARAKGLHRHPAASAPGDPGSAWLHVSAGVGTSPYTRIRVACRPEATLLTLVAGP